MYVPATSSTAAVVHAEGDARAASARTNPAPERVSRYQTVAVTKASSPVGLHPRSPAACVIAGGGCRRRSSLKLPRRSRRERFVYAYYDGPDRVAHEYGLVAHYDAELAATDR